MATTEAENKEKARQITEEVVIEGNLDVIEEFFADDYVGRNPAVAEDWHCPQGVKEFESMLRTALSLSIGHVTYPVSLNYSRRLGS